MPNRRREPGYRSGRAENHRCFQHNGRTEFHRVWVVIGSPRRSDGGGHRQSLWPAKHRHGGSRQRRQSGISRRDGQDPGQRPRSKRDPDGCRHQPRKLGRTSPESEERGGRDQHRHHHHERELGRHRLRHPLRPDPSRGRTNPPEGSDRERASAEPGLARYFGGETGGHDSRSERFRFVFRQRHQLHHDEPGENQKLGGGGRAQFPGRIRRDCAFGPLLQRQRRVRRRYRGRRRERGGRLRGAEDRAGKVRRGRADRDHAARRRGQTPGGVRNARTQTTGSLTRRGLRHSSKWYITADGRSKLT
mmetsp:Transcript_15903/g.36819  ORF Transcript_15903/g.36819 Transcript_15903/m.36819 type:complete len:304 (+) Transcript_15903:726-1637(+)